MAPRNYYVVLGVASDETEHGVRTAFRDLAKRYHPDRIGPRGAAPFREIAEAYEVLGDPERRRSPGRGGGDLRGGGEQGSARPTRGSRLRAVPGLSGARLPSVPGDRNERGRTPRHAQRAADVRSWDDVRGAAGGAGHPQLPPSGSRASGQGDRAAATVRKLAASASGRDLRVANDRNRVQPEDEGHEHPSRVTRRDGRGESTASDG
jgi:curved DNA-binding protein CbpA